MPYRRRRMARSRAPVVIQSYKKVLNFAAASRAAGVQIVHTLAIGTDSVAAGQTGPTDAVVPTGCVLKFIEIQYSVQNLVLISSFTHIGIEMLESGQTAVDPRVVGGNPQRNQVFYQVVKSIGQNQNRDITLRFKIPKRFQRMREGRSWVFVYNPSTVVTDVTQVIYKFYR